MVVHKDNTVQIVPTLGLPVVLKRPDSAFSAGVVKAADETALAACLDEFFETSELVVAQSYVPSEFDWRVGVLDRRPLYAARYHMARGHWQIQKAEGGNRRRYGKVDVVPLAEAPRGAVDVAVRAANLIGDGFYGVDVKEIGGRFLVMEVNDNPNVDSGYEDAELKDELYLAVMRVFADRLDRQSRRKERSS
jgi:glutathione synthase/RimK-type ligase-like ATP-grasp enzyme